MRTVDIEKRLNGLEERYAIRNPPRSLLSDLTDEELSELKKIAVRTKNGTIDVTDEDVTYLEHLAEKYGWPAAE